MKEGKEGMMAERLAGGNTEMTDANRKRTKP